MERLDVPMFTTEVAAGLGEHDADPDLSLLCMPRGVRLVQSRLWMLSKEDCETQLKVIDGAIATLPDVASVQLDQT
jgi:hypothetical protein